jgi:hypothetical protein
MQKTGFFTNIIFFRITFKAQSVHEYLTIGLSYCMYLAKRKTIYRKKLADNGTLAMLDEINIINSGSLPQSTVYNVIDAWAEECLTVRDCQQRHMWAVGQCWTLTKRKDICR